MDIDKVKVPVDLLRVGMYVAELDRPWLETPFIFQGFLITNEDELDQINQYCEYVHVDRAKSRVNIPVINTFPVEKSEQPVVTEQKEPLPYLKQFEEEFPKAKKIYERVQAQIKNTFRDVRIGRALRSAAGV